MVESRSLNGPLALDYKILRVLMDTSVYILECGMNREKLLNAVSSQRERETDFFTLFIFFSSLPVFTAFEVWEMPACVCVPFKIRVSFSEEIIWEKEGRARGS